MLDVFVLGTTLFIHEANKQITMKMMGGLKWMWWFFFVSYTLDVFFALAVNSTIDNVKQMAYIIDNNNEAFTDSHKASMIYDEYSGIPNVERASEIEVPGKGGLNSMTDSSKKHYESEVKEGVPVL